MRRPDRLDLGIVGALSVGIGWLAVRDGRPPVDWVFLTVVTTVLALGVRLVAETVVAALAARRRADALGSLDPSDAAAAAVHEERERLAGELDEAVRECLLAVRAELATGDGRTAMAGRIHAHARRATVELRRQLGLLRSPPSAPAFTPGVAEARAPAGRRTPPTPRRSDLAVAALVTALAVAEVAFVVPVDATETWTPGWVVLTVLAAATIAGRRRAPALSALLCAGVYLVGWVTPDLAVASGAWSVAAVGSLLWSLAVRPPDPASLVPAGLLLVASVGSRATDDPDNAPISLVLFALAWLLGAVVGRSRRRRDDATGRAADLAAHLDSARAEAVAAERLAIARDLHDVVSHAVGVIAVQAAAAEVTWPGDPTASDRALAVIAATTEQVLGELDRVVPARRSGAAVDVLHLPGAGHGDLGGLLGRVRSTGTSVAADVQPGALVGLEPLIYRIAQEGLTNAIRHAPGARVWVEVSRADGEVRVCIRDDGAGPGDAGRGFGLVGLAERVALHGGTLTSGPGPEGRGFAIEARIPAPTGVPA